MRFITVPRRTRPAPGLTTTLARESSGPSSGPSPPDAGHPGVVGQYVLERTLGTGGQGDVFAARDTLLLRPVALKRLRRVDATGGDRHLLEARRSASLRHAAFVGIHGVINDGSGQWIVMERVFGRELSVVMRDGPMALPPAVDVIRQAAQALSEVHRARLVHGDIKPSNLMLQADGDLRILDFGVAQPFDPAGFDAATAGIQAGTVAYMAPERLAGAPPSPASDLYALGAVFLELVGGHRRCPTGAPGDERSDGSASWQFPPGLPGPVVDLIRTMGAPAVEARPAGMEAVVRALDELPVELRAGPPNGQSRGLSPGEPRGQSRGEPRTAGSPTRRSGLHALLPPLFPLLLLLGLSAAVSGDHPAPPGAVANRSVPSDPQEMRAGMDALRRFDEDGAVARATAHFRTVVDRSPRHAAAWAALAIAHCISHRNDGHDESLLQQAREAARRAVMLDGQLALAQAAEGWALEVQGDRSSAMTRYERALRLDPDNVYALNGQVRLLMAQDKFEAALELASAARERHADDRTFIDLLGWLHFEHGDMAAAEREFRASIQTQPDAVFAYANLNATLLRLGRPEEALQVLQRGLQIRPAGRLYTNLGNALYARGDYAAAAAAFQAAADGPHGSPNFYLRWANLADALLWTPGERPASTAAYRRAWQLFQPTLTRDPSPANVSRAALYQARLGMLAEAAASLSSLQARPPDRADPNFRMALAQEALGQRALALQSLRRALSLGYPAALVKTEPAFAALREDPGFASLLPVPHQPPTGDTRP